jgi:hypothetical protein
MAKKLCFPSRFSRSSNVIASVPARSTGCRIIGLVAALALVSLAAACGMADSAVSQDGTALQTAATPSTPDSGFVYFPGQYVNHATEPSEHIQAF